MASGLTAEEADAWMNSHPELANSPQFATVKKARDALSVAPPPAPAAAAAPAGTGTTALPAIAIDEPGAPSPPISGGGEVGDVSVNPAGPSKYDVANQQLDTQGGVRGFLRNANELPRAIGRGIIGDWGDRINAGAYSLMPEALGGRPYAEGLEMERSRNVQSDAAHPIGNPIAKGIGTVMSAAAQPNKGALANTLMDMIASGVRGAGGGNTDLTTAEGLKTAGIRGGEDAVATGIVSGPLNKLMSTLRPYSQVIPDVVDAAKRMGIELPFFARASSPDIQAAGRRYAQTNLDSSVNRAWNEGVTGTTEATANTAVRGTGAPEVGVAPYSAGYQVHPGLHLFDGVLTGADQRVHRDAVFPARLDHVAGRHAERVGHQFDRMGQRDVEQSLPGVTRQAGPGQPQLLRRDVMPGKQFGDIGLVVGGDALGQLGARQPLALALELRGHDDVDTVGPALHLLVDPGEFLVEPIRGEGRAAEHTEAAGIGDRGNDVAAVAEGEQREVDAELVADRGLHPSVIARLSRRV